MIYSILYLHETAEIGGAEKSLLGLLHRLNHDRFTPFFVCGEEGPLVESLKHLGVSTRFLPLPKVRRLSLGRVFETLGQLRQILRHEKIALIHANTPRTNFYAGVAGRLEGIPVIWHARNLLSPFHERIDLDRLFSFLPTRIVCVSKVVQARFRGTRKAVTIYNGVDIEEYRPDIEGKRFRDQQGISESQFLVGMVGRIGPGKGHEDFLHALSLVIKKRENVVGLIVGKAFNDPLGKEAERRMLATNTKLGLGDKVKFVGFHQDIPNVLAALDLFVLPSYAEPFSRSLLEAMACEKAIVATRGGGVPETITNQQTGLLIPPRNPQEIAEAILFLLDRPDERRRLGKEARLRAESSFSLTAHVQALESLYQDLLSKERKGRDR